MKELKNDSAEAVTRFGRDKRTRTVRAEHVEHKPYQHRDNENTENGESSVRQPRRRSFNPNFDAENRPVREFNRREGFNSRESFNGSRESYREGFRSAGDDRDGRRSDDRQRTPHYQHRDNTGSGYRPHDNRQPRFNDNRERFGEERFRRFDGQRPRYDERSSHLSSENREESGYRRREYTDGQSDRRRPYSGTTARENFGGNQKSDGKFSSKYGKTNKSGGFKKEFSKHPKAAVGDQPKPYPKYQPETIEGEIRLNRFIAQSGLCSRREADKYITAGAVTVNGTVITELGTKISPSDEVRFNDDVIRGEQNVYLVLNKPKGYVTTLDDPHASKIVTELVKNACKERIYPVGRLDKNSLGLLLFTNDGELTKQLTHPSYNKKKTYQVTLDKPLTRSDMDKIAEGITLEDGDIFADEIAYIKDNKKEIGIEIHSGRNRIVRRIFEHLGYTVQKLDRVYYAGLTKKNLKRGAWRFLTKEEVRNLKAGLYE